MGVLPPKAGDFGEGFVEFQIDLARSAVHLTKLKADAVIVFDNNEPIETNQLDYTIDSVAPVLNIYQLQENILLIRSSDSGSGVRMVSIYDGDQLLAESNETEFTLVIEPREKAYEIYGSVSDHVGNFNPVVFFLSVSVPFQLVTSCPNNCTSNGVCNQYFACECFDNYTEDDCSRELTLAEILSEPVDFRFGYKSSEMRNQYLFELELDPSFDSAQAQITGFPSQVQVISQQPSLTVTASFTNETSRFEFEVIVPRDYDMNFTLDLVIVAQRILDIENNTMIIVNNSHTIPVRLQSFLPVTSVNIRNESSVCLSKGWVKIQFEIDQLDTKDEVSIGETTFSNTFLSVFEFNRINEGLFEANIVSSELEFEPVDVMFVFEIKYDSFGSRVIVTREFILAMCREDSSTPGKATSSTENDFTSESTWESTTTTTKKPEGLSTWALIAIIAGSVLAALVIIGIIVYCRFFKSPKPGSNNLEMKSF